MKQILAYLGNFGRYQAFLYALLFLPGFLGGSETLVFTWTGFMPKTRCCVPEIDNNCTNPSNASYSLVEKLNLTGMFVPDNYCERCYPFSRDTNQTCDRKHAKDCQGFGTVYDTDRNDGNEIPKTLAIELDLGCDNVWKHQLIWSANTIGVLLGAAIFSPLSDVFGRRPIALFCGTVATAVAGAAMFAANFWAYLILQVCIGGFQYGMYLTVFIVFMELVDGLPRTICGIWFQGMFTIGILWDALFAYILRDWQWIQLAAIAPMICFIPYYWIFPESIRWLITKRQPEKARLLIERAARMNKVTIPDAVLNKELHDTEHSTTEKSTVLSLFSHWRLAKNTLIVWFSWFATSMAYYGLAQNTTDLPGDAFVTNILSSVAEFPGYIVCVPLMEYWGRIPCLVILFVIGGVSCILAGVIANSTVVLVMALLGKACTAATFAVIYNYSAELFPTVVRQQGTGFASVFARVGSLLAPQIRLLGDYVTESLPIIIYGIVALAAGLMDLFLPETLGQELPETIDDGINFGANSKTSYQLHGAASKAALEKNQNGEAKVEVRAFVVDQNSELRFN